MGYAIGQLSHMFREYQDFDFYVPTGYLNHGIELFVVEI